MSSTTSGNAMVFRLLAAAIAIVLVSNDWSGSAAGEPRKHYWATSLSGAVDPVLLQGLRAAGRDRLARYRPARRRSRKAPRRDLRRQCDRLYREEQPAGIQAGARARFSRYSAALPNR